MAAAWWLIPALFLGQTPETAPSAPGGTTVKLSAITPAAKLGEAQAAEPPTEPSAATAPAEPAAKEETPSIFSRPWYADRNSLSLVLGAGPGRFNMIDWESRPNADRLWWLGRWQHPLDAQIHLGLGFNFHWWAGPIPNDSEAAPNLPPRVYDFYLDCSWSQRWSDVFTSEVRFRPGLYTDFRTTPPDAFRTPGQAVGVFEVDSDFFLVGGVEYLERNEVKLLPVGGFLWQPAPCWELRMVFPEPKIAFELSSSQHVWGYVAAEYGGGRWTYKNDAGHSEYVEYSDYRLMCGIEWRPDCTKSLPMLSQPASTFLELGYLFERRLRFSGAAADFVPDPTWMIRFGSSW